jgi:anti-sigma factor RsiW
MTCAKFEDLLSAYLEGELAPGEKRSMDGHLAACPSCAALAGAMANALEALGGFPEVEPSPALLSKLAAIPKRRRLLGPVFDSILRPALQPLYAAFTVLFIALSFVLFHPEGRAIQKAVNRHLHLGYSKVEKIYAEAGSLKDELFSYTNIVLNSFKAINPLKGKKE